jgi:hypothetical protein
MPCAWLSLDAMDISGEMHLDVVRAVWARRVLGLCSRMLLQHRAGSTALAGCRECCDVLLLPPLPRVPQADHAIHKQRLDAAGKPVGAAERHDVLATRKDMTANTTQPASACGSCYGAESASVTCCNTCEQVGGAAACRADMGPEHAACAVLRMCHEPCARWLAVADQRTVRLWWFCRRRRTRPHAQVRQAYQAKGWVLNNLSGIEQCKNDGYLQGIKEQEGEGCRVWGVLTVRRKRRGCRAGGCGVAGAVSLCRRRSCGSCADSPPLLRDACARAAPRR